MIKTLQIIQGQNNLHRAFTSSPQTHTLSKTYRNFYYFKLSFIKYKIMIASKMTAMNGSKPIYT